MFTTYTGDKLFISLLGAYLIKFTVNLQKGRYQHSHVRNS